MLGFTTVITDVIYAPELVPGIIPGILASNSESFFDPIAI